MTGTIPLNNDGKRVCGARTRRGTPCQQTKLYQNGRCHKHGGPSLCGAAHPRYKNGSTSKYYPKQLRDAYERALADPELTALRKQLADLAALRENTLKEMAACPPPPWAPAARLLSKLYLDLRKNDAESVRATLGELGVLLDEGARAALAFERGQARLRELVQETAKVAAVEARRLHDEGLVLTAERALAFVVGVRESLRKHVLDEQTWARGPQAVLEAVTHELAPLLAPAVETPNAHVPADTLAQSTGCAGGIPATVNADVVEGETA